MGRGPSRETEEFDLELSTLIADLCRNYQEPPKEDQLAALIDSDRVQHVRRITEEAIARFKAHSGAVGADGARWRIEFDLLKAFKDALKKNVRKRIQNRIYERRRQHLRIDVATRLPRVQYERLAEAAMKLNITVGTTFADLIDSKLQEWVQDQVYQQDIEAEISRRKSLGLSADETVRLPPVPIEETVREDGIICLENGRPVKELGGYLRRYFNMTPEDYRAKWGLPDDYPMTAPSYAREKKTARLRTKTLITGR